MIKKIGMILMILLLVGCHSVQNTDNTIVYSFKGESEDLILNNGVVVLSPTQQILYGGELQFKQENLSSLLNYSMEFFTLSDEEKETLLISKVSDMTEGNGMSIQDHQALSSVIAENKLTNHLQNNIENDFYFELTVTKTNGDKQSYQIKLDVTKVTPGDNQ